MKRVGKSVCGGLRFDKDATPNARRGKRWVQCYIDQRDSKDKQDLKCSALVEKAQVCKGLGGVTRYGCYHGKTGKKKGATYASNGKGNRNVVQRSCKANVQNAVSFHKEKFDGGKTTFGICVRCKQTACWCKTPKKSRAIECLDGSKRSCGKQKCIKEGAFKKHEYVLACKAAGKILKTVIVKTGFLPEKISWKIMKRKGRHTVCKSKPYDKWHSKIKEDVTRCRLTPGVTYIIQCRDRFGSGWAGGSITIQGVTYCGDTYRFGAGKRKEEQTFVVRKVK